MLIKKRRLINLKSNLKGLQEGCEVVVAIREASELKRSFERIGFTPLLEVEEVLLPNPVFGPISRY